jgi:hypothetical protein
LQAGFDIGVDYLLVANSEIDGMFDQRVDWRPFYTRYPDSGGFMDVSAVGFDPTKARAMVYVAHHVADCVAKGPTTYGENGWAVARSNDQRFGKLYVGLLSRRVPGGTIEAPAEDRRRVAPLGRDGCP